MRLGEIIKILELLPQDLFIGEGFSRPHSYRESYEYIAFEPSNCETIRHMLVCAKSAVNESFEGWKGGNFIMTMETPVYLANQGSTGIRLTGLVLSSMLQTIDSDYNLYKKSLVLL